MQVFNASHLYMEQVSDDQVIFKKTNLISNIKIQLLSIPQ